MHLPRRRLRPRLRLRTLLIAVAVAGLMLGGVAWTRKLRDRAAYYAFVAGAYEVEAGNHRAGAWFYREIAADHRRGVTFRRPYEKFFLFTNDWGGRLTIPRQDEFWAEDDTWPCGPDQAQDQARLATLEARERARVAYFAALGAKYRRAARYPLAPSGA